MQDPHLVDNWGKQTLVYLHDVGWVLGIGFLLGMKWMLQKWLISMWGRSIRSLRLAFSTNRQALEDETVDAMEEPEEVARSKRLKAQMISDWDGYQKLLQDINKTALTQLAYFEARIKVIEEERDHKDLEISELRARLSLSDKMADDIRHECRKARHVADLLCEKHGVALSEWKDLP